MQEFLFLLKWSHLWLIFLAVRFALWRGLMCHEHTLSGIIKRKIAIFGPAKKKVDGLTKSRSSAFVLCMISSRGLNISLFFTYVHAPSGVDNICQPSTPVIMWKAHDSRHMHHFPCNNICPQFATSTTFSHWQHLPNSTFPHLHNVHSLKKDKWWQRLLMVIGGHVLLWAKLLWENVVVGKYRCGKMLQCTWRNVVYAMGECCQFWQKMLWPKVTWWVNVAWRASRANVWWANVIHSFSIRSAVQRT